MPWLSVVRGHLLVCRCAAPEDGAAEQGGAVGSTSTRLDAFGWACEAGGENGSSNAEVG